MSTRRGSMSKSIAFVFLLTMKYWLDRLRVRIAAKLASMRRAEMAQQQIRENVQLYIAIRQKDLELVEARNQIESLQGKVAESQLEIEQLQSAHNAEKVELESLKHALNNGELEEAYNQIEILQAELAERQKLTEQLQNACNTAGVELAKVKSELHEALYGHGLLSEVLRKKVAKEPWERIKAWLVDQGLSRSNIGLFLREVPLTNDSYRKAGKEGKPTQKVGTS